MFDEASLKEILKDHEEAHQKYMRAVFISIVSVVSFGSIFLGLLFPVELPMRAFIGFGFAAISWLLFAYLRLMYSLYIPVRRYRLQMQIIREQRQANQHTTVQPIYS